MDFMAKGKTKFNPYIRKMIQPETWDQVLKYIANGLTNDDACDYAGVSRTVFYEKVKEETDFADKYKKALISFKAGHINNVNLKSKETWQASAWMLERKFRNEFALRNEIDVTTGGEKMNIFVAPSPEIAELINKRMAELHATDNNLPPDTSSIQKLPADNPQGGDGQQ